MRSLETAAVSSETLISESVEKQLTARLNYLFRLPSGSCKD